MYDYISGNFIKASKDAIIIESHGIGWRITVPTSYIRALPQPATQITVYTSLIIRENSQTLFGFQTETERNLFELLIDLNGIGPKTALSLIGNVDFAELSDAILKKDPRTLCRVPGIGKKTAERLLIEMKDLLPILSEFSHPSSTHRQDAISALMNLGYPHHIAQKAVLTALESVSGPLSALITTALQHV